MYLDLPREGNVESAYTYLPTSWYLPTYLPTLPAIPPHGSACTHLSLSPKDHIPQQGDRQKEADGVRRMTTD
jgi:hypothetical protein